MQKRTKKICSVLLAAVLLFGCFTGVMLAYAEDANEIIPIDDAHFPDANWQEVVRAEYDTDGEPGLSAAERNVVTMQIPALVEKHLGKDAQITSLEGIEYFTNLQKLRCADLGLTALDVSKLEKLEELTCEGNELTDLNIKNNVYLRILNCGSNALSSLSLKYNVHLQRLLCDNNLLAELNTSALTELTYLQCSGNKLSTLDLTANQQLTSLFCEDNCLAALDLSANTALDRISIVSQTVTAPTTQQNNTFYAQVALDGNRLVYQETESYADGHFVTTNYDLIKNGFAYEYDTGNEETEAMDVTVICDKNFYVVRFFADEAMETWIASNAVNAGDTAAAPELTQLPQCKALDHWSDTLENITADKDVYAVYKDAHSYAVTAFTDDGVATIACTVCGDSREVRFVDCLNAQTGDANYEPLLDVNHDGYINARDYAILDSRF